MVHEGDCVCRQQHIQGSSPWPPLSKKVTSPESLKPDAEYDRSKEITFVVRNPERQGVQSRSVRPMSNQRRYHIELLKCWCRQETREMMLIIQESMSAGGRFKTLMYPCQPCRHLRRSHSSLGGLRVGPASRLRWVQSHQPVNRAGHGRAGRNGDG